MYYYYYYYLSPTSLYKPHNYNLCIRARIYAYLAAADKPTVGSDALMYHIYLYRKRVHRGESIEFNVYNNIIVIIAMHSEYDTAHA
jgi:hypothetical protein